MTIKQLEAKGWVFHLTHAEKDFIANSTLVVSYDKKDSAAKVARQVTEIENEISKLVENAEKFTIMRGLLS